MTPTKVVVGVASSAVDKDELLVIHFSKKRNTTASKKQLALLALGDSVWGTKKVQRKSPQDCLWNPIRLYQHCSES